MRKYVNKKEELYNSIPFIVLNGGINSDWGVYVLVSVIPNQDEGLGEMLDVRLDVKASDRETGEDQDPMEMVNLEKCVPFSEISGVAFRLGDILSHEKKELLELAIIEKGQLEIFQKEENLVFMLFVGGMITRATVPIKGNFDKWFLVE